MKTILCYTLLFVMFQYALGQTDAPASKHGEFSCYQCNNLYDPECKHGKDVPSKFILPCRNTTERYLGKETDENTVGMYLPPGKEFTLCRKIVTVVDFDVNGNKATERIKRVCGYEESIYDDTCYYRAGLGGRMTVCTCKDKDCNAGNFLTPMGAGLCLTFSLFAMLLKSLNFS